MGYEVNLVQVWERLPSGHVLQAPDLNQASACAACQYGLLDHLTGKIQACDGRQAGRMQLGFLDAVRGVQQQLSADAAQFPTNVSHDVSACVRRGCCIQVHRGASQQIKLDRHLTRTKPGSGHQV